MNDHGALGRLPPPILSFVSSPRLSAALTTAGIGAAAGAVLIRRTIGIPGLFAVLGTLLVLMGLAFLARRRELEIRGVLPLSLLAFLAWSVASVFWSEYQWSTVGGLAYLGAFTAIALFIALTRDTIQVLRSIGDVLRAVLVLSLALEVLSGILIDMPLGFLGIAGRIAEGGPITGITGSRNLLGLIAVVGGITFASEARTRSVSRLTTRVSLVLAAVTVLLVRSPIVFIVALVVAVAALAIWGLRRLRPERRRIGQFAALGGALLALGIAWLARGPLVALFNASGDLNYRLNLWQQIVLFRDLRNLEGWGWLGRWNRDLYPYSLIDTPVDRDALSASNAYLDIWLQLGLIGLLIFLGTAGLAFVRSWLLAGRRRSIVYAWPATVLVALLVSGLAESTLLVEFGWVLFVVCCVKASQELSWRSALEVPGGGGGAGPGIGTGAATRPDATRWRDFGTGAGADSGPDPDQRG